MFQNYLVVSFPYKSLPMKTTIVLFSPNHIVFFKTMIGLAKELNGLYNLQLPERIVSPAHPCHFLVPPINMGFGYITFSLFRVLRIMFSRFVSRTINLLFSV